MMAEGGSELSDSVKDSDYLYEFPCFPCERNGRNVEATKYCADCNENLCKICLTHHNKFATTRLHVLDDQVQTSKVRTNQLPSQRCSKHGGKMIDVFCPEHDAVGCSTCISDDHSSCKGKKFVPDVAAGIKTSQGLKQLQTDMKSLESKLVSLRKRKSDNLRRLKRDKDVLRKEIRSVRKKINEQLDKMEEELVDEAEAKFKEKIDAIHACIAEVDDMLATVVHAMAQVKGNSNDADVFVSCKTMKQEMSNEICPLYARIEERLPDRSLELHTYENTKLIMGGQRMLVSITEKSTIHQAEHKEDINISLSGDDRCKVYTMSTLPNGCFVIADYWNKTLKTLEPGSNNVSTLINLPDNPHGLCSVDDMRLVVSLVNHKKVQFVSLSGKVTLGNSFPVGDRCRGLAHCDGLLYVCCGGFTQFKEGRGHVEVYNCTGELLRCLYEEFGCPLHIYVISKGYNTTMYTSDISKGVQVRRIDGTVNHQFPDYPNTNLPFCLIGTDQLCIGEYTTGDVYIQTYMGKHILISKNDVNVYGKPVCLYYDERSSRLFVSQADCDVIKVFNLKM